jgi:hypothetical protein
VQPVFQISVAEARSMTSTERIAELRTAAERLGGGEGDEAYEREDDLALLREAHWPIENAAWRRSEVTETLAALLDDLSPKVRRGAAIALGHIAPCVLLEEVAARLGAADRVEAAYEDGLGEAVWALSDYYFGDYGCLGYWDCLADGSEGRRTEYDRLSRLCAPVIARYGSRKCGQNLAALLESLRPEQAV